MTTLCLIISLGKKNQSNFVHKSAEISGIKTKNKEIYVFSTINPSKNK